MQTVKIAETVTSVNGSQSNGRATYVGGAPVNVQIVEPAAVTLSAIEMSNDGNTWVAATDLAAAAITGIGSGVYELREQPMWVRAAVASDASAPRDFYFAFRVRSEAD